MVGERNTTSMGICVLSRSTVRWHAPTAKKYLSLSIRITINFSCIQENRLPPSQSSSNYGSTAPDEKLLLRHVPYSISFPHHKTLCSHQLSAVNVAARKMFAFSATPTPKAQPLWSIYIGLYSVLTTISPNRMNFPISHILKCSLAYFPYRTRWPFITCHHGLFAYPMRRLTIIVEGHYSFGGFHPRQPKELCNSHSHTRVHIHEVNDDISNGHKNGHKQRWKT